MRCDATATPAGDARRGALRDRRGRKHRHGARRARPPARVAGTASHSSSSALLFYLLLTQGTALSSKVCEQLALEMKQQRDDRALIEARAAAEEYERAHAEEDGEDAAAAAAHDQVKNKSAIDCTPSSTHLSAFLTQHNPPACDYKWAVCGAVVGGGVAGGQGRGLARVSRRGAGGLHAAGAAATGGAGAVPRHTGASYIGLYLSSSSPYLSTAVPRHPCTPYLGLYLAPI